jgi:hypothetical protein
MLGLLDLPLPVLDFTDTCGTKPNCFTVIDTYTTSTVHPCSLAADQHRDLAFYSRHCDTSA